MERVNKSLKCFRWLLQAFYGRAHGLNTQSQGKRALLISRDVQWCQVVEQAWADRGVVDVAVDLRKGIDSVRRSVATKQKYALIIVDVVVAPEIAVAMREIRENDPEAKVIVATAAPMWAQSRDAFDAGAIDYIVKSLNKNELQKTFERALTIPPPKGIEFQ